MFLWQVEKGWEGELLSIQCSILLHFGPCAFFRQYNKLHALQTICDCCFCTSRLLLRRLRRLWSVHQWRSLEHLSLTLPSWMPFRRMWAGGSKRYRRWAPKHVMCMWQSKMESKVLSIACLRCYIAELLGWDSCMFLECMNTGCIYIWSVYKSCF